MTTPQQELPDHILAHMRKTQLERSKRTLLKQIDRLEKQVRAKRNQISKLEDEITLLEPQTIP